MDDVRKMLQKEVKGWKLLEVLGQGIDGIVYLAKKSDQTAAVNAHFLTVSALRHDCQFAL